MNTEVAIIGAGLAGLTAATYLQQHNITLQVLDKGISVGGRMATRRIQDGLADHGAQFFTARTPEFKTQIETWESAGLVRVWGYGWSDGSLKRTIGDGHPRYIASEGMNALTKHMATGLSSITLRSEIEYIEHLENNGWRLTDKNGLSYTSKVLLMTAPAPQSLALLNNNHVQLSERDRAELERLEYGPCLCGLYVVDGAVELPEPGAMQNFEQPVYWIGDNQSKGISSRRIITLHLEARASRQHYDDPDDVAFGIFDEALQPYLGADTVIVERQLKKWRFSVPITTYPLDVMAIEGHPLYLAGDAFGGRGRVEGAYMSGLKAGMAIAAALGKGV